MQPTHERARTKLAFGVLAVSEKEEIEAKSNEIPNPTSATHQIFRVPYMAKVHKSVGFGSAERCNDDVNVNLFDKSEKSRNYQYFRASTTVLMAKYSST